VDVRLFANRSFLASSIVMFAFAFLLISTTQLLPQLTQSLMGYDATTAGLTLGMGGLVTLMVVPVAGRLTGRVVQPRYFIMGALMASGLALINMSTLDLQMSFWSIAWARVFQVVWLPFLFVSITSVSYVGIPPDKSNEASAIINLMRNLGGSVGVSVATTLLAWQTQFHHQRLGESVSPLSRSFQIYEQQARLSGVRALRGIDAILQGQAALLSYLDIFWIFGVGALLIWPIGFIVAKLPKGASAGRG
jgi:DHA2 family multidrug resistance protein